MKEAQKIHGDVKVMEEVTKKKSGRYGPSAHITWRTSPRLTTVGFTALVLEWERKWTSVNETHVFTTGLREFEAGSAKETLRGFKDLWEDCGTLTSSLSCSFDCFPSSVSCVVISPPRWFTFCSVCVACVSE